MNNNKSLYTILSPKLLDLYDIQNNIVVIIDVFRATSTIAVAMYNGAKSIIPTDSVEECIRLGKISNGITAGERDGKIIPGLEYGNSPSDYTPAFIANKILVLTTTNGTKLLYQALKGGASEIITGSFPNLDAVCKFIIAQNKPVYLACAAWKDRFNIEDFLFAGAVIEQVKSYFTIHCDSSLMAEELYKLHKNDLPNFIKKTTHWHRLSAFGLEKDMLMCIEKNIANCLPYFKDDRLIKYAF